MPLLLTTALNVPAEPDSWTVAPLTKPVPVIVSRLVVFTAVALGLMLVMWGVEMLVLNVGSPCASMMVLAE